MPHSLFTNKWNASAAREYRGIRLHKPASFHTHAFVVRIWWEPGLSHPNGRPLWRGEVEHAASGRSYVFQSLGELLGFIQSRTGDLESNTVPNDADDDSRAQKPMANCSRRDDGRRRRC
jgi:hypothetical protein